MACQPFPYITSTVPNDAIDVGGVTVKVTGYNFGQIENNTSTYKCQFGNIEEVEATLVNDDELTCISPVVTLSGAGSLTIFLRVFVNSQASYNTVPFYIYGKVSLIDEGFADFKSSSSQYDATLLFTVSRK